MKMQNTEMEFVTFDAQDVIMTSSGAGTGGGGGTAWFTLGGSLYNGVGGTSGYTINVSNGNTAQWSNWSSGQLTKMVNLSPNGDYAKDGTYSINTASSYSYGSDMLYLTGVSEYSGSDGTHLNTLQEIISWLNDNGNNGGNGSYDVSSFFGQ